MEILDILKESNLAQDKFNYTKIIEEMGCNSRSRQSFIKKYSDKMYTWLDKREQERRIRSASSLHSTRSSASTSVPWSPIITYLKSFL